MRDSKRIKERNDGALFGRLGVASLVLLGTIVISYNVGLQVGLARAAPSEVNSDEQSTGLSALDTAQQKHDAMQFYTRLTQDDRPKAEVLAPSEVEPELQVVAPVNTDNHAKLEPVEAVAEEAGAPAETTQGAIARLGKTHGAQADDSPNPTLLPANFTIQVSAFQTQEEAEAYKKSLNRKGYHPYVVAAEIPGKGIWYRVRVGRFENKDAAAEAKAELAIANIPSFIVAAQ